MLNRRLKTIVAKPPTSNKKFYQDTEDVLKSLGHQQQHEKEHHRRFVFEEEEGREKTLSSSSSFSETRRKKPLFYKTGTFTRASGTRRTICQLPMRRAHTLGRMETPSRETVRKYYKARSERTLA